MPSLTLEALPHRVIGAVTFLILLAVPALILLVPSGGSVPYHLLALIGIVTLLLRWPKAPRSLTAEERLASFGFAATDADSFDPMRPEADGFRNYRRARFTVTDEEMLLDKAQLLGLRAPEMTVLVSGMRLLGASHGNAKHGVFTDNPGTLSNEFLVHLVPMDTEWKLAAADEDVCGGRDWRSGELKWTGTRMDLFFGCNSQLCALAEAFGQDDARTGFTGDCVEQGDEHSSLRPRLIAGFSKEALMDVPLPGGTGTCPSRPCRIDDEDRRLRKQRMQRSQGASYRALCAPSPLSLSRRCSRSPLRKTPCSPTPTPLGDSRSPIPVVGRSLVTDLYGDRAAFSVQRSSILLGARRGMPRFREGDYLKMARWRRRMARYRMRWTYGTDPERWRLSS